MSYDDRLYHHGIKGMKWGVRRFQTKSGALTALGKKLRRFKSKGDDAPDTDVKKASKPKTVKDMSDSELRSAINRLEMEKRYKELNPEQVSKGKKFVNTVLNNVVAPAAEDVAKQLTKSYMVDAVNKAFKLPDELKVYTNNKKK